MKHRALGKRIISILLELQMVLLQPLCSLADIPQHRPTVIDGARLSEDRLTDGDLVYFGVSGLTVKEASDTYEIAIYREGDLDREASVTVHTLDISALYNKDYCLMGDNIKEMESNMTLLERAAKSDSNAAENDVQVTEYNFDEDGILIGKTDTDEIFDVAVATPTEVKKAKDTNKTGSTEKVTKSKKTDSTDRIKDAEQSAGTNYIKDKVASGNTDKNDNVDEIDNKDENVVIKDEGDTETHKPKQDANDKDKASSSKASKSTADEQDTGKDALKDEDEQGTDENDLKKEDEADDAEEPDETGEIEDKDKSDSVLSVAGSDAVSTGKSRLAILKEEATGEPTREESSSGVSGSLTDAGK